jgi:hypothetical protein
MYCYREESFVEGSFLFKDMKNSTPLECMPQHVRACVDPSNPAASPKIRPHIHTLKEMICHLHPTPSSTCWGSQDILHIQHLPSPPCLQHHHHSLVHGNQGHFHTNVTPLYRPFKIIMQSCLHQCHHQ